MKNKQEVLGQYFTKIEIVERLVDFLARFKKYSKQAQILEPSFGTGNFINILRKNGFANIEGCEIDSELTNKPLDFFKLSLDKKFDLIIGNPPFSKFNLEESYFDPKKYFFSKISPILYLTKSELKKSKEKIENVFILKSLKHLKDKDSSIGFVLPISFFIKNKNRSVKEQLVEHFSTVVVYQNDQVWFDRNIPCCFAIFTNSKELKNKIVLIYENGEANQEMYDISGIHEELIPQIVFHKTKGNAQNRTGVPLDNFLDHKSIKAQKSFSSNNISASNILERTKIPKGISVEDYRIAVVRVGNSSVGKTGLINIKKDVINDMFYVFDVKEQYKKNKQIKEAICSAINNKVDYFKHITSRVGSKSIKKEDILSFKVQV